MSVVPKPSLLNVSQRRVNARNTWERFCLNKLLWWKHFGVVCDLIKTQQDRNNAMGLKRQKRFFHNRSHVFDGDRETVKFDSSLVISLTSALALFASKTESGAAGLCCLRPEVGTDPLSLSLSLVTSPAPNFSARVSTDTAVFWRKGLTIAETTAGPDFTGFSGTVAVKSKLAGSSGTTSKVVGSSGTTGAVELSKKTESSRGKPGS